MDSTQRFPLMPASTSVSITALSELGLDVGAPEARQLVVRREDERVVVGFELGSEITAALYEVKHSGVEHHLVDRVEVLLALVLVVLVVVRRVEHRHVALASGVPERLKTIDDLVVLDGALYLISDDALWRQEIDLGSVIRTPVRCSRSRSLRRL